MQVGRIYHGRVTSVKDFGAFVEIIPGKDGLCHISELADDYVNSVADVCSVGDEMTVKVIAIDEQDRVKLSRKQAMRELNKTAGRQRRRRVAAARSSDCAALADRTRLQRPRAASGRRAFLLSIAPAIVAP